jgi:uncharacterized damage-inducible protein DinB
MPAIQIPTNNEYAVYYEQYIKLCNTNMPIAAQLKENAKALPSFFNSLTEQQLLFSYAEGKWNCKDILQHIVDVERVFLFRAMCFARGEKKAIPFIDENEYAKMANASKLSLKKIIADYKATRQASLAFLKNQTAANLKRMGYASNTAMSVRACMWVICGHELHHLAIVKEKYLTGK